MKKHLFIELILVLAFFYVSFWNVKQQNEKVSLSETVETLQEKQKRLKHKESTLLKKYNSLTEEVATNNKSLKKENQKSRPDIDSKKAIYEQFVTVITKLFEANLDFTPKNYEDRKKEVSMYLSDELKEDYFGQNRKTYQDANMTFSMLEMLEIYCKEIQENELEGIIVVYHKNKKNEQDWIEGMNIFKVKYSYKSNKVTSIINLGSGYSNNSK